MGQSAREAERRGRAKQTERDKQSETGRARQAEPDSQRETAAVERLGARERKAEREREEQRSSYVYRQRLIVAQMRAKGRRGFIWHAGGLTAMLMTYLMSYVLYLIHLMYFSLMLGRVMLTCDSFALVGWTSTPKGG